MSPHMPFGSGYPSAPQADGIDVTAIYGLRPDSGLDDWDRLQDAITANPGRKLRLRKGLYVFSQTLAIADRSTVLLGEAGNRAADGGTELAFSGTGSAIEIGEDDGQPWDANLYNGPQDQWFENLWISHSAPDTPLGLDATQEYKVGAYGIRDWRGGQVRLRDVGIERFEYNFWGVNSDINEFDNLISLYSAFGIYAGPRSDQFTIRNLYSFYCDRALTVDRARQVELISPRIVDCGNATECAVEVRKGSADVLLMRPWLEHLGGYAGTDQAGFVSAGLVDGYGPGGVGTTTDSARMVVVEDPLLLTTGSGIAGHAKCVIALGKTTDVKLNRPTTPVGSSLADFDALIVAPVGTNFTNAQASAFISGVDSSVGLGDLWSNLGAGTPAFHAVLDGASGNVLISSQNSRFDVKVIGGATGAEHYRFSTENSPGNIWISTPTYTGGQTVRLRMARAVNVGTAAAAPSSGTWERGDRVYVTDPSASGFIGWVCVASGTPGTWKTFGAISA